MSGTHYKDPAQERMANGRSLADLMRGGPRGIRGVVVQPSTPGGVPVNFNPHDRSAIEIHVEPEGGNSTLKLSQITASSVEKALAVANEQVQGNDIESIRERTAVAFEELARISKSNVQRVPVKQAVARSVPPPRAANDDEDAALTELSQLSEELQADFDAHNPLIKTPSAPPLEKIDRGYSPMAAFGLKKAAMPSTAAASNVAKSTQVGPPQKLVYFEKEGIGTVPAFFHDVLVHVSRPEPDNPEESGFIVLVYDVRFEQSAARWFPPANDPYQRPWAVQVNDDNRLYLVHTTGFQYLYDAREYCVLLVEKALRAPEGDG
jgi:hypothetical protein